MLDNGFVWCVCARRGHVDLSVCLPALSYTCCVKPATLRINDNEMNVLHITYYRSLRILPPYARSRMCVYSCMCMFDYKCYRVCTFRHVLLCVCGCAASVRAYVLAYSLFSKSWSLPKSRRRSGGRVIMAKKGQLVYVHYKITNSRIIPFVETFINYTNWFHTNMFDGMFSRYLVNSATRFVPNHSSRTSALVWNHIQQGQVTLNWPPLGLHRTWRFWM
jgi:hypothetical protein